MACLHPKEEWTVSTITYGSGDKGLLVFCLTIDGTTFTGEVSELPVDDEGVVTGDPIFLTDEVTGNDEPITGATNLSFMTFNFPWGDTRVMLAGIRFRNTTTPHTFSGRFSAFASTALANAAAAGGRREVTITPQAPGDGDTGTGTGTQT